MEVCGQYRFPGGRDLHDLQPGSIGRQSERFEGFDNSDTDFELSYSLVPPYHNTRLSPAVTELMGS